MLHNRFALTATLFGIALVLGCNQSKNGQSPVDQASGQNDMGYSFRNGYPEGNTTTKAYDDNDLNRAIEAYTDAPLGADAGPTGHTGTTGSAVPSTVDGSIAAAPVANPDRVTDLSNPPMPQPFSGRTRP